METIPFSTFLTLVLRWSDEYYSVDNPDYECSLPKKRIANSHLHSFTCLKSIYGSLDKPSPFKRVACLCMGIMEAQPIQLKNIKSKTMTAGTAEMLTLKDNARMAIGISLALLNVATFECAPDVLPPHNVTIPSNHFIAEFTEALAGQQYKVQGVALSLELIFYLSDNGKKLKGRLDNS